MIKTNNDLVNACIDVAKNYKTLYVMGCFGAPMTDKNKNRYTHNTGYNKKPDRTRMINAASPDTFGFDCVCLIKGLLWGWYGNTRAVYGGAVYASNGVPDIGTEQIIAQCSNVSSANWDAMVPGELLWKRGHVGLYIGNGKAVECTPAWKNGVQITAVENIGKIAGCNGRKWEKHGKLPYIKYAEPAPAPTPTPKTKLKLAPAKSFDKSTAGRYKIESPSTGWLRLRSGPGTNYSEIERMPDGGIVRCYGYHTGDWLLVVSPSGSTGYCSKSYLIRL